MSPHQWPLWPVVLAGVSVPGVPDSGCKGPGRASPLDNVGRFGQCTLGCRSGSKIPSFARGGILRPPGLTVPATLSERRSCEKDAPLHVVWRGVFLPEVVPWRLRPWSLSALRAESGSDPESALLAAPAPSSERRRIHIWRMVSLHASHSSGDGSSTATLTARDPLRHFRDISR